MTSCDAFTRLGPAFDRALKSLDLAIMIEHVRRLEPAAFARHFKGYRPQTLGRKRVTESLRFEVCERKNEAVGDILTLLWNQEHRNLYHSMHEKVKTINEDVEAIERIEDDAANRFVDELQAEGFALEDVLVCVRLNEVRFSEKVIAGRLGGAPAPEAPGTGNAGE